MTEQEKQSITDELKQCKDNLKLLREKGNNVSLQTCLSFDWKAGESPEIDSSEAFITDLRNYSLWHTWTKLFIMKCLDAIIVLPSFLFKNLPL